MSRPSWPPTTPTPKVVNGKRPTGEELESAPPAASQLVPPAPIQEFVPLVEMTVVDTPMAK